MELYLLRHGIPVDPDDWQGDDASRPLTDAGEVQVERVLTLLKERGEIGVDALLASPYQRTQQTARIAAQVLGVALQTFWPLASGRGAEVILNELSKRLPLPERLLLVGHSPDLSMVIGALTGSPSALHPLDRCGIARLEGELAPGWMRLSWLRRPTDFLVGAG